MSNKRESKPQIKLNKKMRMWNKYRMICISILAVVVAVVVVSAAIKGITGNKENEDNKDVVQNVTTTADSAIKETQSETQQSQSVQEQSTQPVTQEQQTTQVTSGTTLKLSGAAESQQFTKKDFYEGTVFLGDSVISGIESYGYLDNVHGDVNAISSKLTKYVDEAVDKNVSKVFVMVGHNDANYGTIKEEVLAQNIVSLAEAVHKKNSNAKVYVLSITPITSDYEKKQSVNVKQSYIDNANKLIEQNASAESYTYIDVASAYKDGTGYLKTECTGNGINLSTSYYPFLLNGIADIAK